MRPENMGITACLLSFSQSRLRREISYMEMSLTLNTLYTSNIQNSVILSNELSVEEACLVYLSWSTSKMFRSVDVGV